MFPVRAQTRTTRSGDERTDHEKLHLEVNEYKPSILALSSCYTCTTTLVVTC